MKLSFEIRLTFIFLAFVIAIAIIGFAAYRNNQTFVESYRLVGHTEEVLDESDKVLLLMEEIQASDRGYVITGDTSFLKPYYTGNQMVFYHLGRLKDLTRDNMAQQNRIDSLARFAQQRINYSTQYIDLVKAHKAKEAAALVAAGEGKYWMDKVHEYSAAIEGQENQLLKARKETNDESMGAFNRILMVMFVGMVLLVSATFITIMVNLSFRKKLSDEIRQTNSFLNTILENIPNMIFVKDAKDLRFVRFNKAGERLLGQSRVNLIGKNDYDFFPRNEADFFTAKDKDVINQGDLVDIPEEPISTGKGTRWLHTKKIPIMDESGKPQYLLGISEDITDHKRQVDEIKLLNKELEKTINQLIQANKEMEAFTYSVSHDLRAPLRIIDGFGEIMLKDYSATINEEGKHTLGIIISNARHMGQLIDDLLNLSRLGRTELSIKPVDMLDLVKDVIEALKILNEHITTEFTINYLMPTDCDPGLVRQVWVNLISNAIKYSRKHAHPRVEIGSFKTNDELVYYVKDNGVGFDMRYSHKLFGVFQRLHKISEFEGTGVGLALVYRIVTKHGGRVWAEGKVNEGATFYFTIS